jgi:hypothetical protein
MAYLTKSRFKLGLSCPTKLYYDLHRDRYPNASKDDEFLKALAEGGFQVGEYAKLHYPSGIDIQTMDPEQAVLETEQALADGHRVLFEAALKVGHCLIRVDVLELTDEAIRLIEVKSTSVYGADADQLMTKAGTVRSGWFSYVEDLAFQTEVARAFFKARGDRRELVPFLFCPDTEKPAECDGLHGHFLLQIRQGQTRCVVSEATRLSDLGASVMSLVPAADAVRAVIADSTRYVWPDLGAVDFRSTIRSFEKLVFGYATKVQDVCHVPVGMQCKECEFRIAPESDTQRSGMALCFAHELGWDAAQIQKQKVWELWNFREASSMIEEGRWFLEELQAEDVDFTGKMPTGAEALQPSQRRWLQVAHAQESIQEPYLNREGLRQALEALAWPLHCIDFETVAPALPFFRGYAPYQGLPFQFSHHILEQDGRIRHASEYLCEDRGADPTWPFIEHLVESLEGDAGSIFRYANHENTFVNYAIAALESRSPFGAAKTEKLSGFLKSISKPSGAQKGNWEPGVRNMIDLAKLVKDHYWHPRMGGSNSIKAVLPAVLEHSIFLQEKYRKPIYGSDVLPSLNFADHRWLEQDEHGRWSNPYKRLPALGLDFDQPGLAVDAQGLEAIAEGGAAMMAWIQLQSGEIEGAKRNAIAAALKRYCELDTMAMVMILEFFLHECGMLGQVD